MSKPISAPPAADSPAAPAAAPKSPVPLRASELAYLTEHQKRRGAVAGEVREQRVLDPDTGTVTLIKARVVKTKRPRGVR